MTVYNISIAYPRRMHTVLSTQFCVISDNLFISALHCIVQTAE